MSHPRLGTQASEQALRPSTGRWITESWIVSRNPNLRAGLATVFDGRLKRLGTQASEQVLRLGGRPGRTVGLAPSRNSNLRASVATTNHRLRLVARRRSVSESKPPSGCCDRRMAGAVIAVAAATGVPSRNPSLRASVATIYRADPLSRNLSLPSKHCDSRLPRARAIGRPVSEPKPPSKRCDVNQRRKSRQMSIVSEPKPPSKRCDVRRSRVVEV